MPKPQRTIQQGVQPLETRHVFMDTQVYRSLHHSATNPALKLLCEHISNHRVVLHIADVTLREIERQIREKVLAAARQLNELNKDISTWQKAAPQSTPTQLVQLAPAPLASELFSALGAFLRDECKVTLHEALREVSASDVFDTYFARKPPFDGEDSKEFPDGFVVTALSSWCRENDQTMYVVTQDRAFLRAVTAEQKLLPLKDIHELLPRAAAEFEDGEAIADTAINGQNFDYTLEEKLGAQIGDVTFIYTGDLAEGEAYEGSLQSIENISNFYVVGLNDRRVTVMLTATLKVTVEVQYEDREAAAYDSEDGRWLGTEAGSAEIEDEIEVSVLAEVDRGTGEVVEAKILDDEISVSEPSDWDY